MYPPSLAIKVRELEKSWGEFKIAHDVYAR